MTDPVQESSASSRVTKGFENPHVHAISRRRLKGDLDNIILKALRKEPERRYVSAEQLSEDIRRHLRGLPVAATPDSISYRAGKFVRRNKVAVSAAALVLVAVLAGLTATLYEAHIAAVNQRRAERRFNDVRKLANSLLTGIYDSVRDLPGSTPSRKLIVDGALEYLDSLAQESSGDESLQRELAAAYEKVGRVQGGDPGQSNLGDTAGAVSSFRKMIAVRQALAQANPNNVDDQVALARSYRAIADVQAVYLGDVKGGLENSTKAVAISEAASKAHPAIAAVTQELAADYDKLGDIQGGGNGSAANLGDVRGGLANHLKALALIQILVKQQPDNLRFQRTLAVTDYKLQNDLLQTGDRAGALLRLKEAVGIFESHAKQKNNASAQRDLGATYTAVAILAQLDGRFADALLYYRKSAQLLEPIVAADPKNVDYREDLAETHAGIGYNLCRTGNLPEGLTRLRQTFADVMDLYQSSKTSQIRATLASIQVDLGAVLELNGQLDEALKSYLEAQAAYQSISSADPSDINNRSTLADVHNRVAGLHLKLGNLEQSGSRYQDALAINELLAAREVENLGVLYSIFETYAGLGDLSAAQARKAESSTLSVNSWNEARKWYRKSLDASNRIPNKSTVSPDGLDSPSPQIIASRLVECDKHLAAERSSVAK